MDHGMSYQILMTNIRKSNLLGNYIGYERWAATLLKLIVYNCLADITCTEQLLSSQIVQQFVSFKIYFS